MTAEEPNIEPASTHVVVVATYNTIQLEQGHVYTVKTPFAGPYFYNVLNLGPQTIFYRADDDPHEGDPESLTLPAHFADNLILVPEGRDGLRFVADKDEHGQHGKAKISLRLVRG